MSVELQVKNNKYIRTFNMKNGQIGVVVKCMSGKFMDYIVQRCGDHLFAIGRGCCWLNYFNVGAYDSDADMVRLLEHGDILVVHQ